MSPSHLDRRRPGLGRRLQVRGGDQVSSARPQFVHSVRRGSLPRADPELACPPEREGVLPSVLSPGHPLRLTRVLAL